MKQLWRMAGLIIAMGLMAYFFWFAWRNLEPRLLAATLKQPGTLLAVFVATLCYMTIYPATGFAWRQLLLQQRQPNPAGALTRLISIAQLAKYIPGNIAQHAGRAALAFKRGIPLQAYVASVLQETLLASAASIIVGVLLLSITPAAANLGEYRWLLLALLGGSIGVTLLLCIRLPPFDGAGLAARALRIIGGLPGPSATLLALAAYICNYLMIGLGVWLLAVALGLADSIDYPLATAAFALSWILGFLAPGTPAGLGAREGIMTLILVGHGNSQQIVQLVLLARVTSMCGDLLSFLVATLLPSPPTQKPATPS